MTMIRESIEKAFSEQGLIFLGIVDLDNESSFVKFKSWLEKGRHAGMSYLEKYLHCRQDPRELLANAKSSLVFAFNYNLNDKGIDPQKPRVAQYARFKDYHKMLRTKGENVLRHIATHLGDETFAGRVMVDTAPLLERSFAAKTQQGFIGKNTMYIHPNKGSFLLLGEIFLSLDLDSDQENLVNPKERVPGVGGCGSCTRCQSFCPTGALDVPYELDSNKCLSYWSIEHRGVIPIKFWPWFKKYYFGCDICQLVCPYNRGVEEANLKSLTKPVDDLDLNDIACMDQEFYEQNFGGTPMTRAKIEGLRRNALIAMVVTDHPKLKDALDLADKSEFDVLQDTAKQVREQWVLGVD